MIELACGCGGVVEVGILMAVVGSIGTAWRWLRGRKDEEVCCD